MGRITPLVSVRSYKYHNPSVLILERSPEFDYYWDAALDLPLSSKCWSIVLERTLMLIWKIVVYNQTRCLRSHVLDYHLQ